jgi:hypothetical protein
MKTTNLLAILGLATLILAAGCQQATDTKKDTAPDIKTAPAATQTKWNNFSAAMNAGTVAMSAGTPMASTYLTTNTSTNVSTINYPTDANGMAVTGTLTPGTTSTALTMTITITNATDATSGTKVSGSMNVSQTTDNKTHAGTSTLTANFTATFPDNTQSTVAMNSVQTTDAAGQTTVYGTVTIDGVTYSLSK